MLEGVLSPWQEVLRIHVLLSHMTLRCNDEGTSFTGEKYLQGGKGLCAVAKGAGECQILSCLG